MDILTITAIIIAGPVIGSFIGVLRTPSNFFINNFRGYPHVSGVPYNVIPVKTESMFIATIARWTPAFAGVTNFT